jgi:predicted transposase YbfD/YdcC
MVIRERTMGTKTSEEICYYISSIEMGAKLFEYGVRGHWEVENCLHWRLDVIFREDESRYRDRIGAQNLSVNKKNYPGNVNKG